MPARPRPPETEGSSAAIGTGGSVLGRKKLFSGQVAILSNTVGTRRGWA